MGDTSCNKCKDKKIISYGSKTLSTIRLCSCANADDKQKWASTWTELFGDLVKIDWGKL